MRNELFDYLTTQINVLTFQEIMFSFGAALLLGMVIFLSYKFSYSGAVYSARFNVSLVMLTLVTTVIMNVIGHNIALSLGMVGALSIVRFRTAVKDPRDTAYIFWCIAVGVCCGVGEFFVAGIGSVTIFVFMLLFGSVKRSDHYLLIVSGSKEAAPLIDKTAKQYFEGKAKVKVMNTTVSDVEYIYSLSEKQLESAEKKNKTSVADMFHSIEGVVSLNLVSQNDEINR